MSYMRNVPWHYIGITFSMLIASQILGALRLHTLLITQNINVSFKYTLQIWFTGLFGNVFLPGTVGGDVYKLIRLISIGHSKATIAAALVVDRILGFFSMLLFLPFLVLNPQLLDLEVSTAIRFGFYVFAAAACLLLGLAGLAKNERVRAVMGVVVEKINQKLFNIINKFVQIAIRWSNQPWAVIRAFILSCMLWFIAFFAGWIFVEGINLPVTFTQWIGIQTLIYFATLLPVSLNGLGIAEVSMVYLLGRLGVAPEEATALAVTMRVLGLFVSLPGLYGIVVNWYSKYVKKTGR